MDYEPFDPKIEPAATGAEPPLAWITRGAERIITLAVNEGPKSVMCKAVMENEVGNTA